MPRYQQPFQSPSLRGSGRFTTHIGVYPCGRVMFQSPSLRGSGRFARPPAPTTPHQHVSIPFIAGQWSLPRRSWTGRPTRPARFNPLHCGAVVASNRHVQDKRVFTGVFQSPSLRGSGRFTASKKFGGPATCACFNPLHCGAVVASRRTAGGARRNKVSIPFIAGQWSLRRPPRDPLRGRGDCFNPLHCGAVVASEDVELQALMTRLVSIPFIAGQWSLRNRRGATRRFPLTVSIPFIAGQWSLPAAPSPVVRDGVHVSIPFIAGQWSLRGGQTRVRMRT